MLRLYICYSCAFPFKSDENAQPAVCPGCGASPDNFLSEPYNEQEKRRIHVDPPIPDPNRDPMDLTYHVPKRFPKRTRHGRLRRFVLEYDCADTLKDFYTDIFGWDIINTEHSSKENPTMYCATGPGNPNWEPRVVSFTYGFMIPKSSDETGAHPLFMVEVDNIETTIKQVEKFGGKLLKPRFTVEGNDYAIIYDSEGNGLYLWETPSTVTWNEPESQTIE
ncbi:MAG: hypothetical protein FWF81_07085 [Defluviitaleaceae bacterium]|nr:hypothetical protein [Defluviitaleaceae bacterium]